MTKNSKIYARNLFANWFGHGADMLIMFFLSPFVVEKLGAVEYGIWSLLTVLTGYMGILDLGVRASTGRYIILYLGKEDYEKTDETIRSGLGFYSIIGLVILLIGIVLGLFFQDIFQAVPKEYNTIVNILLPVMAVNVWFSAVRAVFSSILVAHDRFDIARIIDVSVLIFRAAGTVIILIWGHGIAGLTFVVVAANILGMLANGLMSKKIYSRFRFWPLSMKRERIRELLGYGTSAFISSVSFKITGQTDMVVVGAFISVQAVTVYSVGAMMVFYSTTFIGLIGNTFFPPVQRAAARNDMDEVRWLFFRQLRLGLLFGLPLYIGFIVYAEPFIRLWMLSPSFPESSVKTAALVMLILSGSRLFYLFTLGSNEILAAIGYVHFNAALAATEAVVNISLSLFFVLYMDWGLLGVAGGTLVSRALIKTAILPWYACRKAGMDFSKFIVHIGLTGSFAIVLFWGACILVDRFIGDQTWSLFWLQVFTSIIFYIPIAFFILLPADYRRKILDNLTGHLKKN
ncbi:MAG: oligosaccharide flippase family protein [Desulfococcaceae bacterium]